MKENKNLKECRGSRDGKVEEDTLEELDCKLDAQPDDLLVVVGAVIIACSRKMLK